MPRTIVQALRENESLTESAIKNCGLMNPRSKSIETLTDDLLIQDSP